MSLLSDFFARRARIKAMGFEPAAYGMPELAFYDRDQVEVARCAATLVDSRPLEPTLLFTCAFARHAHVRFYKIFDGDRIFRAGRVEPKTGGAGDWPAVLRLDTTYLCPGDGITLRLALEINPRVDI